MILHYEKCDILKRIRRTICVVLELTLFATGKIENNKNIESD